MVPFQRMLQENIRIGDQIITYFRINMKQTILIVLCFFLASCAPEVGSDAWCKAMKEKPKGEWTASEAGDFAKHCVF